MTFFSDICELRVRSKHNLNRHLGVHQQNKVKCEHCNLLLTKSSFRRHKRLIHETIKSKKNSRGPYKGKTEYSKGLMKRMKRMAKQMLKADNDITAGVQEKVGATLNKLLYRTDPNSRR